MRKSYRKDIRMTPFISRKEELKLLEQRSQMDGPQLVVSKHVRI
jgi:hypothetical protein